MVLEPTPFRWDVRSYQALGTLGILDEDARLELLDGEIIRMTPIGSPHQASVDILTRHFVTALGSRAIIRVQGSFVLDPYSQPQPDVVVLRPRADFYRKDHPGPDDVLLAIEVSDSTVRFDRLRKVPLYAAGGVPEVWLVNLPESMIEVYRRPGTGGYDDRWTATPGETVSPAAFPDVVIPVSDVLGLA